MSAIERRKATLRKLENDVRVMKEYARFVLVLDGQGGVTVVDNGQRFRENRPYASIIAVVGPLEYEGSRIQETILLEIGYNRARPYLRTQFRQENPRISINARHRIRELHDDEIKIAYPCILNCMSAIVTERRSRWKGEGRLNLGNSGGNIEVGIYFSISKKDVWLHRQMLQEHVRFQEERYMRNHVGWLAKCLRYCRRNSYTAAQLKSFENVHRAYRTLSGKAYARNLHLEALLASISRMRPGLRPLVERILFAFGMEVGKWDEETELYFSKSPLDLPFMETTRGYIVPWQPKTQGNGCCVVEVSLHWKVRKEMQKSSRCGNEKHSLERLGYAEEIPF